MRACRQAAVVGKIAVVAAVALTACSSESDSSGADSGGADSRPASTQEAPSQPSATEPVAIVATSPEAPDTSAAGGELATFDVDGSAITFQYPAEYELSGTGVQIGEHAVVQVEDGTIIDLGETLELRVNDLAQSFVGQGAVLVRQEAEVHNGIEFQVIEVDVPEGVSDNAPFTSWMYYFEVGSPLRSLWRILCVAPPESRDEVRSVCDQALATVERI